MTIHVVIGPPCSGKSSFVEANAPAGIGRFDFDNIAGTVAGQDVKNASPNPVANAVLAMRRGLMGWLLDVELDPPEFWLINAQPSPALIAALSARGATFHLCDPGMEECLARAARDGRPQSVEDRIRQWYDNPPELPTKGGHEVKTKSYDVSIDETQTEGTITAYASVFGNVDSYGDVVIPGAFEETLGEWQKSGNTIPLLYGHDFKDPFSNIGGVTSAVEDAHGLKITAQLDLDNPKARQVYNLLKAKRLSQMSFAFDVVEGSWGEREQQEVYELKKVKLYEVSVVPIGANQETSIIDVKSVVAEELANILDSRQLTKSISNKPPKQGAFALSALDAHLSILEKENR